MNILVTGGAGFIGSHTCVELLQAGHSIVVLDNFCNSHIAVLARITQITGRSLELVEGSAGDRVLVEATLRQYACDAVVHFAGLKSVGESIEKPLDYYDTNVVGTLGLLEAMQACGVHTLLFSSSATVYGKPERLPLTEDHPLVALNPYGHTKLVIENMLRDLQATSSLWRIGILRYFNPVGAHESGLIGEDPKGVPSNLLPFVAQVAVGMRDSLTIWGNDYDTKDGTGVRDYIHVVDLARGHLCALEALARGVESFTVNLGTGRGYSVLDVVSAFEQVSGRTIPVIMGARRAGDVSACYADVSAARKIIGWTANHDLLKMCSDSWNWQMKNPHGYQ